MIKFDRVSKIYNSHRRHDSLRDLFSFKSNKDSNSDEFVAVDNVSFHIEEGSSVGLMGTNGAGKSTVLKLMTRIILPTMGEIKINGKFSSLLEVGAGFHQDLSGYENVYLSGAILGMSRKQVKQKFDEIIAFSEIDEFIGIPVKYYSSGMYLRLAFSIGVSLSSDILVIDEAISVGDANFQNKCIEKIKEIKRNGKTIVFVSHDKHQVESICDKVIVLEHGKKKFDGNITDGLQYYDNLIG
ncbi:ABC transporter ATP-binding protein [Kluyvera ascorbata]|uniref:ABC transporter ATP-binding protein n=1 Tax=Kluyvera ascorbata TaxID=51288 RepID=UPI0029407E25|nr:ABC transporter ATP-binding protein [Kluyvera ascorbata]HED1309249.1 ABC transporter ATP-binding protein [Kluyvera ascorbata]